MLRRCLPTGQPSTVRHCLGGPPTQQYTAEAGAQPALSCVQAVPQVYRQGKRTVGDLQPANVMLLQDSLQFINWAASMAHG